MKRLMLAVTAGLLLSCQGPAAVLAREAVTAGAPAGAGAPIHRTPALNGAARLAGG